MTQYMSAVVSRLAKAVTVALMLFLLACSSPEEKAQAHLERGLQLLEEKKFKLAGLEFRNAVKFNEKLTAAWLGLSEVIEQEKNWVAVGQTLTKVLELDPSHFEAHLRMSKLLLAGGNFERALAHINKANELKEDQTDVLAGRATVLLRLNDRVGARRDAERALSLNPDSPDALAVLAADKLIDDEHQSALLFIDRGLATSESNLGLLLFKIRILEQTKDYANVEGVMRKLISFYPETVAFRRALVAFLTARNRRDEAEAEMRAIAKSDPGDAIAGLGLVRFIGSLKGPDAARAELVALIAAHPEMVDYNLALAQLDFAEKRVDQATADLDAIIAKGEPANDVQRARLLVARIMLQTKKTEAAGKLISEVLTNDEKNAEALALRATMRIEAYDVDSAVADLREALGQQPRSVPLLQLLGRAFERQGSVDLAEERYGQAVKLSNFNAAMTLDYVTFLNRRGKAEQAEQTLTEAVSRNPNNRQLLTALARTRLNRQDWAGAEAVAEALKRLGKTTGVSDQILGAAQLGQKKFAESIATFRDVYSQTPGATRPMFALASAYVRAGKLDEAERFLQSVISANQDNADAHVLIGSLRQLQKKPAEAQAAYNLAIERQPTRAVGYKALADHFVSQGKIDAAEEILRTGRDKVEKDTVLGLALAGVLEAKRDVEGAIGVYEELLAKRPDVLIVVNNLASLLADHRQDEASLTRASNLSQRLQSANVSFFKDTLGWIAYRRGEYRAALSHLEDAATMLPKHNLVRYHLGMTYVALDRAADAKKELAVALELSRDDDSLKAKIETAIGALPAN